MRQPSTQKGMFNMKILLWIIANWDSIAILLVVLIGIIVYIRKNGIKAIKAMLLAWITQVEADYGSGTGALKKAEVAAKLYAALPVVLRLFISEATISKLIEAGLAYAKTVWSSNVAINNYIEATGTIIAKAETTDST